MNVNDRNFIVLFSNMNKVVNRTSLSTDFSNATTQLIVGIYFLNILVSV